MFPLVVEFRNMLPFPLPDSSKGGQKKLLGFLQKAIREHRATFQAGSPRDFIDVFLEEKINSNNPEEDGMISKKKFIYELVIMSFVN